MNRLQYYILADTQYNIQSPFLYDLYTNVVKARLGRDILKREQFSRHDLSAQMLYKLSDHYHATIVTSPPALLKNTHCVLTMPDGSFIAIVNRPHRSKASEQLWNSLFKEHEITLSVDFFDIGLLFTSVKLSKQHFVLR
ncbi:MAG: hypothetical protein J5848_03745 [Bacteroidales bacterium]|nr:hypothetical protein [Bacteroidales bacterium]